MKLLILGTGSMARAHAMAFARIRGVSVVAAVETNEARLGSFCDEHKIANRFTDLDKAIAWGKFDASANVTPDAVHHPTTMKLIAAGKHVFCEKPLALQPSDCDRAVAVAADHPRQVLMVGFMRRFDPAYADAKRRIDAGELGEVFAIRCVSEDPVDPEGFFVRFAPTSGGIFLDCCIHDIDLVRWMLGGAETAAVDAVGSRIMYPALGACGDIDTASANVAFKGGQIATFFVSRTSHRGYEASMRIVGDKGALDIGVGIPRLPMKWESDGRSSTVGQVDFFERFGEAFLLEARAFVKAIQSGEPTPISLKDAREATRLACAMRDALKLG